jgi:hypothetical protein
MCEGFVRHEGLEHFRAFSSRLHPVQEDLCVISKAYALAQITEKADLAGAHMILKGCASSIPVRCRILSGGDGALRGNQ